MGAPLARRGDLAPSEALTRGRGVVPASTVAVVTRGVPTDGRTVGSHASGRFQLPIGTREVTEG
jgi:hypothetical protein